MYFHFIQQQAKESAIRRRETSWEEEAIEKKRQLSFGYNILLSLHWSNSSQLLVDSLSEFIQKWHAVGSRCICDTIGSQLLPESKRPQYMECNAESTIGVESEHTKPCS